MTQKRKLISAAKILFGTILVSAAVKYIYSPAALDTGGVSGVAVILESAANMPLWLTNKLCNIPLFVLGWIFLGWAFIRRTLAATALMSLELYLLPELALSTGSDLFLAAVFGGLLAGLGMGLVFSATATTGGTDLLAALLQLKWKHVSIPKLVSAADFVIIAAGIFVFGVVRGLYALVAVFVTARVSDFILVGMRSSKAACIISRDSERIADAIMEDIDRGVTGIHAKGMYSREEMNMLYCVVSPREIPQLKQIVQDVDPGAFVIISDAGEVTGEGFTWENA
jgi:uncharacterized membrane-anchored protein YitT (DUF2179 family)